MNEIDLTKLKDEPCVSVIAPDGSTVWTGNSLTHFDEIRAQIKEKKLSGYSVETNDGCRYEINTYGRVRTGDIEGKLPGDVWTSIVERLL